MKLSVTLKIRFFVIDRHIKIWFRQLTITPNPVFQINLPITLHIMRFHTFRIESIRRGAVVALLPSCEGHRVDSG